LESLESPSMPPNARVAMVLCVCGKELAR
jgi:hypothetical protein